MSTKHFLIPTDFSRTSLKLVSALMDKFPEERVKITMVHPVECDASISSMLMLNKRLDKGNLFNDEFMLGCEILRNKYDQRLVQLQVELIYLSSMKYLKRFAEARQIEGVVLPNDYTFCKPSKNSINLNPLFARLPYQVYYENTRLPRRQNLEQNKSVPMVEML